MTNLVEQRVRVFLALLESVDVVSLLVVGKVVLWSWR
jgi:hypothetical protein